MKQTGLYLSKNNRKRITGFTLVEMMIAMTISTVLLGGVIEVFLASKQAYRLQESQARMQENARFLFAILSNSIRQAGYTGCNSRKPGAITNTLNNASDHAYRFGTALEGYEAETSSWSPTVDAAITSPLVGNDIIVIRGALDSGIRVVTPFMNTSSASLRVTSGNDLEQEDIVMVTDCSAASILQISNATPSSGSLVHNTGNVVSPSNATSNLGKIYRDDAEIIKMETRAYYIRTGANGLPAIYQRIGLNAAEELIEGVEGMQILYGEDTDNDSNSDRFLSADQVDMEEVVAVRISILLQSITDALTTGSQSYTFNGTTVTPTDHRVRRVFTTTIALRNRIP
jgi:type IV pilus assembly protein PilW